MRICAAARAAAGRHEPSPAVAASFLEVRPYQHAVGIDAVGAKVGNG
jgi:hypothetical protein